MLFFRNFALYEKHRCYTVKLKEMTIRQDSNAERKTQLRLTKPRLIDQVKTLTNNNNYKHQRTEGQFIY